MKKREIVDLTVDELISCLSSSTFMRNLFRGRPNFPYWEKRVKELQQELNKRVSNG